MQICTTRGRDLKPMSAHSYQCSSRPRSLASFHLQLKDVAMIDRDHLSYTCSHVLGVYAVGVSAVTSAVPFETGGGL